MERPSFGHNAPLLGTENTPRSSEIPTEEALNHQAIAPFLVPDNHYVYLEHPVFHNYLRMHKVTLGLAGAERLRDMASELEEEYMPGYQDAAAWAYAESALVDTSLSAVERVGLIHRAEFLWERAASRELQIQSSEYQEYFHEPSSPYRYALPILFAPLMKGVVVGNVTESLRTTVLKDVVHFAEGVSEEIGKNAETGDKHALNLFVGLAHELNAYTTLLYLNDPRYVPLPSTARADTGYYHREQTHDIMVLNQHWGAIRKVIPIEIKAKASRKDRRRYKALLIRGKMHLTTNGLDPRETTQFYSRIINSEASVEDIIETDKMATEIREMLRLYQKGMTPDSLAVHSLMRFTESQVLHEAHPEIAP